MFRSLFCILATFLGASLFAGQTNYNPTNISLGSVASPFVLLPTNTASATDGQVLSKTGDRLKFVAGVGGGSATNAIANTNGVGTNTTLGGNTIFRGATATYGANQIQIQGTTPPAIDAYQGVMRLLGMTGSGFSWRDSSSAIMSLGQSDSLYGPRSYYSDISTWTAGNDVRNVGGSKSSYQPFNGGSGASLAEFPIHGPELFSGQPLPAMILTTATGGTSPTLTTSNLNATNMIYMAVTNGFMGVWTNNARVVIYIDTWLASHRLADGTLSCDSNRFALGIPWLARHSHSNNTELWVNAYYSTETPATYGPVIGNTEIDVNLSGTGQFGYPNNANPNGANPIVPIITADSIHKDFGTFYGMGVDGFLGQDMTAYASLIGYQEQYVRQLAAASLYPFGQSGNSQDAYWAFNYSTFNNHPLTVGALLVPPLSPSLMYLNGMAWDAIATETNAASGIGVAMGFIRYAWPSIANAPDKSAHIWFALESSGPLTTTLYKDWQSMFAVAAFWQGNIGLPYPGYYMTNAAFKSVATNMSFLSMWQDAAVSTPKLATPVNVTNFGTINSVWTKTLSTGQKAALLVNEDATAANLTVYWTNMGLATGVVADASEMWTNTYLGQFTNSYTVSVAPTSTVTVIFTPISVGNFLVQSNLTVSGNTTLNNTTSSVLNVSGRIRLLSPTNATTIVNLGLDANGNISSNAVPVGGSGSTPTFNANQFSNGSGTDGTNIISGSRQTNNQFYGNVAFAKSGTLVASNSIQIGSPATADSGQLLLYSTNGHLSRFQGINAEGVDQTGFSIQEDSLLTAFFSTNHFKFLKTITITNTDGLFVTSPTNLFEAFTTNGGFMVYSNDSSLKINGSLQVTGSGALNNTTFHKVQLFNAFTETTSNVFQLFARGNLASFPVPYFRPNTTNSVIAFDIIPNGNPVQNANGMAWLDVCNSDCGEDRNPVIGTARVGSFLDHVEFGSYLFGASSNLPVQIMVSGGTVATFATATKGQLDISKDSNWTTEQGGITIGVSGGNPELILGADSTHGGAYIQPASKNTSFSGVPLVLCPAGGNVDVRGIINGDGSGLTNLSAIILKSYLAANATSTSITLANTLISVTVISGHKYVFDAEFFLSDSVAADGAVIDFNGGTATATNFRAQVTAFDTALNFSTVSTALNATASATTFTGNGAFECHGSFEPSSSGTFIIRFAQNAHTTGTLTLARGSNIVMHDTSL